MGKDISSVPSLDLRITIEDMADTFKDMLPSANTLIELSTSEFILDLSGFVDFYESKPKYEMERGNYPLIECNVYLNDCLTRFTGSLCTDVVWPVPRPILNI